MKPANNYAQADFWSKKAFAEGYPARSIWKLKEIDEKFHLIEKSASVLDLGSAPGSWTMYVSRKGAKKIVSCDLNELSQKVRTDNVFFVQGDLNESAVREKIASFGPYDTVLCDAAPLTTGNRIVDTARSENLADMALYYAEAMLKRGGNFAVKIFQNGNQQTVLKKMRDIFASAKIFKPVACRSESFETYLIGLQKKI